MTLPQIIGLAVFMALAFIVGLVVYLRRKQKPNTVPHPSPKPVDPRETKIDHSATVLRQLLVQLTDTLRRMDGATNSSSTVLLDTRKQLHKIEVDDSLRETQSFLLKAIDGLIVQNNTLRDELRSARQELCSQQEQIESLRTAVRIDELTQVANRASFDERLSEAIEHFKRYQELFCLLMIDIDHFKDINDTHGHQAGDRILKGVATKLKASIRGSDFLARYGGEEFGLILPKTNLESGVEVADKIREAIEFSKFNLDGNWLKVTVSAGVAQANRQDTDETLLKRADKALYQAKETGRNRVCSADSINQQAKQSGDSDMRTRNRDTRRE